MPEQFEATAAQQSIKVVGWARVYAALERSCSKTLRRGAWYAVIREDVPDRVTIQMHSRSVDVPRRLLEIRREQPTHFSVVHRFGQDVEEDDSGQTIGLKYLVCPKCAFRSNVFGQPLRRRCVQCHHEGEVGWWEG